MTTRFLASRSGWKTARRWFYDGDTQADEAAGRHTLESEEVQGRQCRAPIREVVALRSGDTRRGLPAEQEGLVRRPYVGHGEADHVGRLAEEVRTPRLDSGRQQ